MRALPRLIIALLLVITLPVQAMSAVAGGICMTSGQHGDAHIHDEAPDHAAAHDHGPGSTPERSHCPPCAACCASAAIAPGPFLAAVWTAHAAVNASPGSLPLGQLPRRLDRPPLAS